METLVISGGGSWGAFTVGRLLASHKNYNTVIGCSTGSLIAPFALLGKYDLLKEAYSNVCNKDIFNVDPFNKKGNLRIGNAILRLFLGKRTLGENKVFRKTISKYFTIEIYNEILLSGKDLYVTVCNISKEPYSTEYISIKDHNYETFCDYIWASCSVPLLTSIVNINTDEYVDGGTLEGVPLTFAINKGNKKIDVYLHEINKVNTSTNYVKNMGHFFGRIFKLMRNEIRNDDLRKYYTNALGDVDITLKYMPYELDKPLLHFNKTTMSRWINEGYIYETSTMVA